jgi:hypothetical protein
MQVSPEEQPAEGVVLVVLGSRCYLISQCLPFDPLRPLEEGQARCDERRLRGGRRTRPNPIVLIPYDAAHLEERH